MALIEGTTTRPKRATPRRTRPESPGGSSGERRPLRSEGTSRSDSASTEPVRTQPRTRPSAPSDSTATDRAPSAETSPSGTGNSNSAFDRGYDFSVGDIDFQRYDGEANYIVEPGVEEEAGPDTTQYVEIDGQMVHPSDVHLHHLAPEEPETQAHALGLFT